MPYPASPPADRSIGVLIVEDEPDTRDLLAEYCQSRGFEVHTTGDGQEAVATIRAMAPPMDIVITDLNLPGADGFDVLQAARAIHPSCYVVIITGYATLDSAIRAVRGGAYDYLAKPFALGQLEIVLARIRDRMALEAENRDLIRRQGGVPRIAVAAVALDDRLAAIHDRLARIEVLLEGRPAGERS